MTPERLAEITSLTGRPWWSLSCGEHQDIAEELLVALADANEKIRNQAETIDALRREKETT